MNKEETKKNGRPTKYKPEYCEQILAFFNIERTKIILEKFYYKNGDVKEKEVEVANELPTLQGFAISIGVTRDTLHKWIKKHKKFLYAYKEAKTLQEDFWLQNSIRGLYPGAFTIFAGKNMFGWRDKNETDITSGGEKLGVVFLPKK